MIINGKEEDVATPITVAELVEQRGLRADRVAVELNGEIVPRASVRRRSSRAPTRWKSSRSCRAAEHSSETNHTSGNENTRTTMTFEPSASQAQIDARQHAFDNQPDPATLVSREEIRAALLDRHTPPRRTSSTRRTWPSAVAAASAPPSRWR